ncbi:MAG: GIY-YIG nuclease family protein [Patescibacteria group bacterium]|nr:GIY-YIG nuclease family protein [Patescibacteria group bacterium]
MFYVYLLKSKKDQKLYIGFANDLKKRFIEHNKGLVQATEPRRPFEIIYYESYKSKEDAKQRESRLKRYSRVYHQLKTRIEKSLI